MSLSDYSDELHQIESMTKAHQDRERNYEWCKHCQRWHSRYTISVCETRKEFYNELRNFINYNLKEGCIDEELADEVLCEWDYEHQKDWLEEMDAKGTMAAEQWIEEQAERDAMESERRDNSE